jgi:hypothetical protein
VMTANASGLPTLATDGSSATVLRLTGGLAVLVVGAVHIQQYFVDYYRVVPIIGRLFVVNFISAMLIGILLLLPVERLADRLRPGSGRVAAALAALGGIALAAPSAVFLFVSEGTRLFGFRESGYRLPIYVALSAEAVAVLSLGGYLILMPRRAPRP